VGSPPRAKAVYCRFVKAIQSCAPLDTTRTRETWCRGDCCATRASAHIRHRCPSDARKCRFRIVSLRRHFRAGACWASARSHTGNAQHSHCAQELISSARQHREPAWTGKVCRVCQAVSLVLCKVLLLQRPPSLSPCMYSRGSSIWPLSWGGMAATYEAALQQPCSCELRMGAKLSMPNGHVAVQADTLLPVYSLPEPPVGAVTVQPCMGSRSSWRPPPGPGLPVRLQDRETRAMSRCKLVALCLKVTHARALAHSWVCGLVLPPETTKPREVRRYMTSADARPIEHKQLSALLKACRQRLCMARHYCYPYESGSAYNSRR